MDSKESSRIKYKNLIFVKKDIFLEVKNMHLIFIIVGKSFIYLLIYIYIHIYFYISIYTKITFDREVRTGEVIIYNEGAWQ